MTKILRGDFKNMYIIWGRCYGVRSSSDYEDLTDKIIHVALLENYSNIEGDFSVMQRSILYTLIMGPIGWLFSFLRGGKLHIECIIYLNDKREIHIDTTDKSLIKHLYRYMRVYKSRKVIK